MTAFTVARTLGHSPETVWDLLHDFGGIHRWSAGVERSPINPGTRARGVGAERTCHLYDGNHIQERVTESVDQERMVVEVFETSMPLQRGVATFKLAPTPAGGTRLSMHFDYAMKYGLLGKAMDALMVKRSMVASLERLLAALDAHLTTGEEIGEGWQPRVPAVGAPEQQAGASA